MPIEPLSCLKPCSLTFLRVDQCLNSWNDPCLSQRGSIWCMGSVLGPCGMLQRSPRLLGSLRLLGCLRAVPDGMLGSIFEVSEIILTRWAL